MGNQCLGDKIERFVNRCAELGGNRQSLLNQITQSSADFNTVKYKHLILTLNNPNTGTLQIN